MTNFLNKEHIYLTALIDSLPKEIINTPCILITIFTQKQRNSHLTGIHAFFHFTLKKEEKNSLKFCFILEISIQTPNFGIIFGFAIKF